MMKNRFTENEFIVTIRSDSFEIGPGTLIVTDGVNSNVIRNGDPCDTAYLVIT